MDIQIIMKILESAFREIKLVSNYSVVSNSRQSALNYDDKIGMYYQ